MNLRAASRQLLTSELLDMLQAIERTYWRHRFYFVGPKHAWALPGTNDNRSRNLTERDATTAASSISSSLHGETDTARTPA